MLQPENQSNTSTHYCLMFCPETPINVFQNHQAVVCSGKKATVHNLLDTTLLKQRTDKISGQLVNKEDDVPLGIW